MAVPEAVLYGALPNEGLAVLEEREALERADELRAVMACRTVGELRALTPQLQWTPNPLFEDDQRDDKAAFNWEDAVEEREGDWPTMPAQLMLELPAELLSALADRAGATTEATMINGEVMDLPRDREADLIAVLDDLGIAHRRDDDVFGVLAVESLHVTDYTDR